MNVFDYAQTLWNHRPSHTFGVSGATYGTGSESRAGRVSTWGGADLGRLAFCAAERVRDRADRPASGVGSPARAVARAGVYGRAYAYQACVRVQWGQPTEVVTSASNA